MNYEQYVETCREHFTLFNNYYRLLIYYPHKMGREIGPRKACIVATKINNQIHIGWSMCHLKKEKRGFNKYIGLSEAIKRLAPLSGQNVPRSLQEDVVKMYRRSLAYFKEDRYPFDEHVFLNCDGRLNNATH